jgi:hypothetical protein
MSAGRPVRKRVSGFANDIAALNRLRTALKITPGLDENEARLAIRDLDALVERLAVLHQSVENRKKSAA